MELTQKQWREFQEFKNEYEENELTRNLLLQHQNELLEGGLRSANLAEYRNTYVINAQDSLDATYPMYVHFSIISEMTKIVSIKLSFWFLNFRAYSKSAAEKEAVTSGASSATSSGASSATSSGASSASSSASGGGQTPTSGASSASSSSGGGVVSSASGGGETPTSSSKTTPSGGGQTSSEYPFPMTMGYEVKVDENGFIIFWGGGGHMILDTAVVNYLKTHTHYVSDHTHPSHSHTVTVASHTHVGGTHTHNIEHTHTVTITSHTHNIAHTHNIEHAHNIEHTHTVPAHTHDLAFGIYEEETSPTIVPSISRDNGLTYSLPIGSYTKDQNLDITRFIDKAGSKLIKFTSDLRARLSVQVTIKLDIKAR